MTTEEMVQFKALAKKFEDKDKDEVVAVLKADIHPVFQEINDGGRTAANLATKDKITLLEGKVTAAETERDTVKAELGKLNGQAPDAAKLKDTYDRQLADLQATHKTELEKRDGIIVQERLQNAEKQLAEAFVKAGVKSEYANVVLVKREDIRNRLKPGQDGQVQILKAGTDLPLVPPGGDKTVYDLLAEEVTPTISKDWRTSKVKRGSATNGSEGGAGDTEGSDFDTIRAEAKAKREASSKVQSTRASGFERLRSGRR